MNEKAEDEAVLKRYLLGELAGEEQGLIEERLFLDGEYLLQLQAVEDELVDDYIYNDLPVGDRGKFETHFLSRPGRSEELRFARALKKYIAAEETGDIITSTTAPGDTGQPQATDKLSLFPFLFKQKPAIGFMLAMAAGVVFVVLVWLAVESIRHRRSEQVQAQRSESVRPEPSTPSGNNEAGNLQRNGDGNGQIVRQDESLHGVRDRAVGEGKEGRDQSPQQARRDAGALPTPHQPSGRVFTVLLLPGGSVRGEAEANKVILPPDTGSLILQLPLIGGENYRRYQATLQQGNRNVRTWTGLKPIITEAGQIIPVIVPSRILQEQTYQITLGGLDAKGYNQKLTDYSFRLEKR